MTNQESVGTRLVKFAIGLCILFGLAFCLGRGMIPPGVLGEVIRSNYDNGVNATALFYSELANMKELEREVVNARASARNTAP